MNDDSARLTAHIGGRIVELNDYRSAIEAMDLSQWGDLSTRRECQHVQHGWRGLCDGLSKGVYYDQHEY